MPHLFSHGALRQDDLQRAPFGRLLRGQPDMPPAFARHMIAIDDPADRSPGPVFAIPHAEPAPADEAEAAAPHRRVGPRLGRGPRAGIAADARRAPPA